MGGSGAGRVDNPFLDSPAAPVMFDVDLIERQLRTAAAKRRDFSYSEMLLLLGLRFTRPKMRALCRVLDAIDQRAAAAGQPELAVLVVRESDRLPGQGWWIGRRDYAGAWEGPQAWAHVDAVQAAAFEFWGGRQPLARRLTRDRL
jgi:hypothetical protein